jgi:YfiR/HmsC-like
MPSLRASTARPHAIRTRGGSRRNFFVKIATTALLNRFFTDVAAAESGAYDPGEVKARMLRKLIAYFEWPATSFSSPSAALVVGIPGGNESDGLVRSLKAKPVGGRPVEIRFFKSPDELDGCQMMFFGSRPAGKSRPFLAAASGKPVLTIGEGDDFLDGGGMVRFDIEDNHVVFDVNLPAVRKAGLDINSGVLAIARKVKR